MFSRADRYALCASTAILATILLRHKSIDPWTLLEEVRNKYNYLKSNWELTYFGNGSNDGVGFEIEQLRRSRCVGQALLIEFSENRAKTPKVTQYERIMTRNG